MSWSQVNAASAEVLAANVHREKEVRKPKPGHSRNEPEGADEGWGNAFLYQQPSTVWLPLAEIVLVCRSLTTLHDGLIYYTPLSVLSWCEYWARTESRLLMISKVQVVSKCLFSMVKRISPLQIYSQPQICRSLIQLNKWFPAAVAGHNPNAAAREYLMAGTDRITVEWISYICFSSAGNSHESVKLTYRTWWFGPGHYCVHEGLHSVCLCDCPLDDSSS